MWRALCVLLICVARLRAAAATTEVQGLTGDEVLLLRDLLAKVNASSLASGVGIAGQVMGKTTATSNGDVTFGMFDHNGYDDAKALCVAAFPAPAVPSHVCTAHELSIAAQNQGKLPTGQYWFIDLSMTHFVDEQYNTTSLVQDCNGWSSKNPNDYGNCVDYAIVGGTVLPSICNCARELQFICCTDYS